MDRHASNTFDRIALISKDKIFGTYMELEAAGALVGAKSKGCRRL
jgi:hypothetical protein